MNFNFGWFASIFRHAETQEEDCPSDCRDRWQEVAVDPQEAGRESDRWNRGGEHDQERRLGDPLQQPEDVGLSGSEHLRRHRTLGDEERKLSNFWRAFGRKVMLTDFYLLQIADMLPGIINHLGPEGVNHLKKIALANNMHAAASLRGVEDEDIPDLVQNFESEVNIDEAIAKGPVEVVD